MVNETENIKPMNGHQSMCWYYVMDIHDPENYWYSVELKKSFENKTELLDYLRSL